MTAKVVTISASVGAGGSVVGPAVGKRLGLQFVDRIIPAAVAASLDVPIEHALAYDEKASSLITRLLAKLGSAAPSYGPTPTPPPEGTIDEDVFRTRTEQVIRDLADKDGAVVLGRAAALVLAGYSGSLHVRLDGARDARVDRVAARQGVDKAAAAKLVDGGDRAREAYVRHFYRVDPRDARLYHLTIDSIGIPLEVCVDLITAAAAAIRPGGAGPASSTGQG